MALSAVVTLPDAELEHPALWDVRVTVRNDGDAPRRLLTATLLGALSFEVVDAAGARVAPGPPPTPPADPDADVATVAPGAALDLAFHGDELLADTPPPGRYRLRFAAVVPEAGGTAETRIVSPWVDFTVAAR